MDRSDSSSTTFATWISRLISAPRWHIALWAILIHHYFRHSRGMVRALILIWFSLILLSTVLTYQHHLIDVAGGFVLSTFCFYLYPDEPLQRSETFKSPNRCLLWDRRNSLVRFFLGLCSVELHPDLAGSFIGDRCHRICKLGFKHLPKKSGNYTSVGRGL